MPDPTTVRIGLDRIGLDRIGLDRIGLDRIGCDRSGSDRSGLDVTLLDRTERRGGGGQPRLGLPGRGRVGLLCNAATVGAGLRPAPVAVQATPGLRLERIFSPQHGFAGEKQDNMIESADGVHRATGVPIVSLYGRVREPEPAMLDGLDALLIDVPDVGTRVYTFLSTAIYCVRTCARAGIPVIVLDRPNPIGGDLVEGPVLDPAFASFVGVLPVPLRHGLTAGETCLFGAASLDLPADIEVVRVEGWTREAAHDATGLPWVLPSPNLPTLESAFVYPGMVMLEGTNLSEGRGTTRPFELFGAAWLDPTAVLARLHAIAGPPFAPGEASGYLLREVAYEPTFHKYAGETVRGFQIHVTDRRRFRPVAAATAILCAIRQAHAEFEWRLPPYEYEHERMPIDLIAGTDALRLAIDSGADPATIAGTWIAVERAFLEASAPFLLYPGTRRGTGGGAPGGTD